MLIRPGFSGVDPWAGVACKDGGTSSSSSSSTNQQDQRVAATDQAIAVGPGGSFSLNIENPDGFRDLIAAGAGFFEASLEFASEQQERSFAFAAEAKRSETQHLGLEVLKSAAPILLVVGLGAAMVMAAKNG